MTLVGNVLQVATGSAPNPPASVQVGSRSVLTDAADGSFTLTAPAGTTSVLVQTNQASGERTFTFNFPAATGTTVSLGELWIGPSKVTLTGTVRRATDNAPVAGATVAFGGQRTTTGPTGAFSLPNVAYSAADLAVFWGISGSVTATNFFRTTFSAAPNAASAGRVNVGTLLVVPSDDPEPPGGPFNVVGRVLPTAQAPGTVVTLRRSGTAIRTFTIPTGSNRYTFWVTPGNYTVTFQKGSQTAPARTFTLRSSDEVASVGDVTLGG